MSKILTLFEDAAKSTKLFPKTRLNAIYDSEGNRLDRVIAHIEEEIASSSGGGFDIDKVYPVGAIYISVSSGNPGDIFGGTWEQIQDAFLLSAGTTYTAGATGGSSSHDHTYIGTTDQTTSANNGNTGATTVSINQLPSHSHSQTVSAYAGSGSANTWKGDNKGASNPSTGGSGGGQSHTHTLGNHSHTVTTTGSVSSKTVLPPYLVVYVWKRTA